MIKALDADLDGVIRLKVEQGLGILGALGEDIMRLTHLRERKIW